MSVQSGQPDEGHQGEGNAAETQHTDGHEPVPAEPGQEPQDDPDREGEERFDAG